MNIISKIGILLLFLSFGCVQEPNVEPKKDTASEKKAIPDKVIINKKKGIVENIKVKTKIETHESKSCKDIVLLILKSSPRFTELSKGLNKAVVKNGGQSFGISLDGSPNPITDNITNYSKTYDFTFFETYPDRQVNTARFSFNPNNKKLYEYDVALDQLKPIEFDRSLLLKYNFICN